MGEYLVYEGCWGWEVVELLGIESLEKSGVTYRPSPTLVRIHKNGREIVRSIWEVSRVY